MSEPSLELFMQAFGAAGPLELEVRTGPRSETTRRVFRQHFALVGRVPRADVFLDDEEASPRHAYLQVVDGRVVVLDLDSRTGTRWNDVPQRSGLLRPGEQLTIGTSAVRLIRGGQTVPGPESSPMAPQVWFEFTREQARSPAWEMRRPIALAGRSKVCHVRLKDKSVSRVHCSFVRTPLGVWVVDLRGRGGSVVNGNAVRLALLNEGDELRVGRFSLRCRYTAPAQAPSASVGTQAPSASAGTDQGCSDFGEIAPPLSMVGRGAIVPLPVAAGPIAATTERGDSAAALLPVLMSQLAGAQTQMFEQFQQALAAILQELGAWHSDQIGLIRHELRQLRETTRELQELQGPAGLVRAEKPSAAQAPSASPGTDPEATAPASAAAVPALRPAADGASSTANGCQASPDRTLRIDEGTPAPASVRAPGAGRTETAGQTPEDIHDWLSRRVEALEQEREGAWQRLFGLFSRRKNESG